MPPRQPGDQIDRPGAAVAERLVEDRRHRLEGVLEDDRRADLLEVLGAEMLRQLARQLGLVAALDVAAEGEGARPVEIGDQGARVDAAAQEDPHRHVGQRVLGHHLGEHRVEPLAGLAAVGDRGLGRGLPVGGDGEVAVAPLEPVRRLELLDPAIDGLRRRDALVGEVVAQRGAVDRRPAELEQRLDLGGEGEAATGEPPIVEGLDPQPVARGEQRPALGVPDGEGEHPHQGVDARGTVAGVEVEQHLGVAVGAERTRQPGAQLAVVVDLAVEDQRQRPQRHRLVARRRQIEDRQPGVPELSARRAPGRLAIGPPVDQPPGHRLDPLGGDAVADDAGDSADGRLPREGSGCRDSSLTA